MNDTPLPPRGWVPFQAFWQDGELWADWCRLGENRFLAPFFEATIESCLSQPFNQLFRFRASMGQLLERQREAPGLAPGGFIFHMSRCGSTLVSQMLASLAQNIVISEASPIDAVLQARRVQPGLSEDQQILWLRAMIGALGCPHRGERHLFIKFDCWHTQSLPLIRRAFPSVPWVFLYRDPIEVLVSHVRQPGTQMVSSIVAPELFGIATSEALRIPADEYRARVLANICEAALRHYPRGGGALINYSQLPDAVRSSIVPHFGVQFADADHAAMAKAAERDAKSTLTPFMPDSGAKQREAKDATRAAAETWLTPLYRQLEALRQETSAPRGAPRPSAPATA